MSSCVLSVSLVARVGVGVCVGMLFLLGALLCSVPSTAVAVPAASNLLLLLLLLLLLYPLLL